MDEGEDYMNLLMTVSPDVFSEMWEKQMESYDFLCVDHEMRFRHYLREKFGLEPRYHTDVTVHVDYSKPKSYWGFREMTV